MLIVAKSLVIEIDMHQVYEAINEFSTFNQKGADYQSTIFPQVSEKLGEYRWNSKVKDFLAKAIQEFNIEPLAAVEFVIEKANAEPQAIESQSQL